MVSQASARKSILGLIVLTLVLNRFAYSALKAFA